jgi:hypothetical protein
MKDNCADELIIYYVTNMPDMLADASVIRVRP